LDYVAGVQARLSKIREIQTTKRRDISVVLHAPRDGPIPTAPNGKPLDAHYCIPKGLPFGAVWLFEIL
jgi:hypothetical protein